MERSHLHNDGIRTWQLGMSATNVEPFTGLVVDWLSAVVD